MEKQKSKKKCRIIRNITIACFILAVLCFFFSDIVTSAKAGYLKHKIKVNPEDLGAHFDLAAIYLNSDNLESTVEILENASKSHPDDPDVHIFLGCAYEEKADYSEPSSFERTKECYLRAIELNPESYEANIYLADVYFNLEEYDSSIEYYLNAIKLDHDYGYALFSLGLTYYELEQYDFAIDTFEEVRKLDLHDDDEFGGIVEFLVGENNDVEVGSIVNVLIGRTYERLGDYKSALTSFYMAKTLDPNIKDVFYNLGQGNCESEYYEDTAEAYEYCIKLNENGAQAYFEIGKVYLDVGDKESAIEQYKILENLDSELSEKLYNLIYE